MQVREKVPKSQSQIFSLPSCVYQTGRGSGSEPSCELWTEGLDGCEACSLLSAAHPGGMGVGGSGGRRGGSGQTTWESREAMQTHHVQGINPGVRGPCEGAELLTGGNSRDVQPGRDRHLVRGQRWGWGAGFHGRRGCGAGQGRMDRAVPTSGSLSFQVPSP